MTQANSDWLTLGEAGAQIGMSAGGLADCVRRGELKGEIRHRPRRGRPAMMVRAAELAEFAARRGLTEGPALPAHLRELIIPLAVASRLVKRSKQRLHHAILSGSLPAGKVDVGPAQRVWHVRLGDVERWLALPGRGRRRMSPRTFDPEILGQLEAVAGLRAAKAQNDGSTLTDVEPSA